MVAPFSEHRAPEATTSPKGRGLRRAVYFDVARRLRAASRALDESLLGAVLGTVIIAAFMVAIPVLLPIIFEVLK